MSPDLADWLLFDVSGVRIGLVLALSTFALWLVLAWPSAGLARRCAAVIPADDAHEVAGGLLRILVYSLVLFVPSGLLAGNAGAVGYQLVRVLLAGPTA